MTVLQAVAMALSGDCCCQEFNDDGTCCMTEKAIEVFAAMERAGGPSLADCEAFAELTNFNDQPALGGMHKRMQMEGVK
jgi:hypothetical protein